MLIEKLFNGSRSHSLASYPLRVVYLASDRQDHTATLQLLISVPKRNLKHAVDRNRVKRLIREAYRSNRHILTNITSKHPTLSLSMAFIWLDSHVAEYATVENKIRNLLLRVGERIEHGDTYI